MPNTERRGIAGPDDCYRPTVCMADVGRESSFPAPEEPLQQLRLRWPSSYSGI